MTDRELFRGKRLFHIWMAERQTDFADLVNEHGRDKFDRVYDWLFRYMEGLEYGQWFVVEKVCPKLSDRPLLYFVLEMIYQGDLASDFAVRHVGNETRIECKDPSPERRKRLSAFLGERGYILVDWYGRLRRNPNFDKDIDPSWFGLDQNEQDQHFQTKYTL